MANTASIFSNILASVEPFQDTIYGPRYRCSLTLKDGTFLPCAVIQSKSRIVELAKRRIKEEMQGKGRIGGADPFGQIVATFVARGNRINDYDVMSASESKYAIPRSLLLQIKGETTMGWTGWVFRMKDGRFFSYGSSFSMEFFSLPDGYDFSDVVEVINHSFVGPDGELNGLGRGVGLPDSYKAVQILRERVYFTCAIEGIDSPTKSGV
jgi:hypothetical protein